VPDGAETPSAAMRSRQDLLRLEVRTTRRSETPVLFLNRAQRILFQKHVTAGRVLLRPHGMAQ
jgi:DNA repair protein RadC